MEKTINKNNPIADIDIEVSKILTADEQAVESALKSAVSFHINTEGFSPSVGFSEKILASISTVSPYAKLHTSSRVSPYIVGSYNKLMKHLWKVTVPVVALAIFAGSSTYYSYYPAGISGDGVAINSNNTGSANSAILADFLIQEELQEELDAELMAYSDTDQDVLIATYDTQDLENYNITI